MALSKTHKYHLQCVVCGSNFGSKYDPEIKAYPIYHPPTMKNREYCEENFYKTLLRIYLFLLEFEHTVPVTQLIEEFDWQNDVIMQKDMISWCLVKGFLSVDGLKRIEIPSPIQKHFKGLFEILDLNDTETIPECVNKFSKELKKIYEELTPIDMDKMPFKQSELNLGESTLFDNIDTSKVELRSDKRGITNPRVKDSLLERRLSSTRLTKEKKFQR